MKQKMFVIRKYVMASSASEAIKKERKVDVADCYLDEKPQAELPSAIGFAQVGRKSAIYEH